MIFLLELTIIIVILTIIGMKSPSLATTLDNKKTVMPNKIIVIIIIIILTFFAAIRSNIGDTGMYMHSFKIYQMGSQNPLTFNNLFAFIFNGLLKNIWDNPQIVIIVTSIIIYPCIIWRLYKSSINPIMSVVLFIFSVSYVSSMNGVRQYLVSAVLFFLYPWIIKQVANKKYLWILLILFLALFHSSVLITIPVFYMSDKNPFSKSNFFIYFLIIVGIIAFNFIMPSLFNVMESAGLKYSEYTNASYGTLSTNPFRILFYCVPIFLCLYLRNNKKVNSKELYFIENMTIYNGIFMILSYYGAVYARFCIYFEFYPMLLYPVIIKYIFNARSQVYAKFILYIVYFLYMYYQIQIAWGGFILQSNWLGLTFGG